jgi:hypothetical protein
LPSKGNKKKDLKPGAPRLYWQTIKTFNYYIPNVLVSQSLSATLSQVHISYSFSITPLKPIYFKVSHFRKRN